MNGNEKNERPASRGRNSIVVSGGGVREKKARCNLMKTLPTWGILCVCSLHRDGEKKRVRFLAESAFARMWRNMDEVSEYDMVVVGLEGRAGFN